MKVSAWLLTRGTVGVGRLTFQGLPSLLYKNGVHADTGHEFLAQCLAGLDGRMWGSWVAT